MTDDRRFDDIDPELRPTAERVADALRAEIPPEVARRHEELLRAKAAGGSDVVRPLRRHAPLSRRPGRRPRRTLVALVAAAVLVLALPVVAVASDDAAPGDLLYGVDRTVERLELAVATGASSEVRVLLDQAAERLEELETLEERGRLEAFDALLEDLREAEDRARETAGADDDLEGTVLTAIELHTQRLQEVRDRLEASGESSPTALDALDRAIEAGRTAAEADGRGRPDEPGAPTDRPGLDGPGRTEAPGDRPTQAPGRPDDAGPGDDEGSQGNADQAPDDRPGGPDEAPNGPGNEGGGDAGQDGQEYGGQQAEENRDGPRSSAKPRRSGPPGNDPR